MVDEKKLFKALILLYGEKQRGLWHASMQRKSINKKIKNVS